MAPLSCLLDVQSPEAYEFVKKLWRPVLELTHNHGTENDVAFKYHNGNDPPQGFGHIGLLCNDLEKACEELEAAGVAFRKKPRVCGRAPPSATKTPHPDGTQCTSVLPAFEWEALWPPRNVGT